MSDKTLGELLYVGRVYIDVGYDTDTPTARTLNDSVFGAMELGGEIGVKLVQYAFGDPDDLREGDPPEGSVEMWKNLLGRMRSMLARCMILGEMQPVGGELLGSQLDAEDQKNLDKAIADLGEDFFQITLGVAMGALMEREEGYEAEVEFAEKMVEFMGAQQERPDENITLGEAVERHEERTEEVRRIVEGEEEDTGGQV